MSALEACALIDCDEGRRLGCRTFCCRLIVRLTPEERARGCAGIVPPQGCVPKDPDGYCTHLDRETSRCRIWESRPEVCRAYDCNRDPLLQAALRGFSSLLQLVLAARFLSAERTVAAGRVPALEEAGARETAADDPPVAATSAAPASTSC